MKILLLGPDRPALVALLASTGDIVERTEEPINAHSKCLSDVEWIVSYGYRHIIRKDVLDRFPNHVVNLHIAYLPWNRGADPNLWSILEDSPKGVTVHFIDAGVDTGDIVAQEEVVVRPEDTLRTSYERLSEAIEKLFGRVWPRLRSGEIAAHPQPTGGSAHRLKDKERVLHLLTDGWDTPVSALIGKRARNVSVRNKSE